MVRGGHEAVGVGTIGRLLHCPSEQTLSVMFSESWKNARVERWPFSDLCLTHFP